MLNRGRVGICLIMTRLIYEVVIHKSVIVEGRKRKRNFEREEMFILMWKTRVSRRHVQALPLPAHHMLRICFNHFHLRIGSPFLSSWHMLRMCSSVICVFIVMITTYAVCTYPVRVAGNH